jgi:hypothetical protein
MINNHLEMTMDNQDTLAIHVKGVNRKTHAAIKGEAARRNIKQEVLYVKVIESGARRLKIIKDKE